MKTNRWKVLSHFALSTAPARLLTIIAPIPILLLLAAAPASASNFSPNACGSSTSDASASAPTTFADYALTCNAALPAFAFVQFSFNVNSTKCSDTTLCSTINDTVTLVFDNTGPTLNQPVTIGGGGTGIKLTGPCTSTAPITGTGAYTTNPCAVLPGEASVINTYYSNSGGLELAFSGSQGGVSVNMTLTSLTFIPASATPEPGTQSVVALSIVLLAILWRQRMVSKPSRVAEDLKRRPIVG
ncbi:MAG TPA: hypothetical protein VE959_31380 [Bryobacteraceae bacterium]|nr:hypothetical protein [Bryobacteraceae bacterium]